MRDQVSVQKRGSGRVDRNKLREVGEMSECERIAEMYPSKWKNKKKRKREREPHRPSYARNMVRVCMQETNGGRSQNRLNTELKLNCQKL